MANHGKDTNGSVEFSGTLSMVNCSKDTNGTSLVFRNH